MTFDLKVLDDMSYVVTSVDTATVDEIIEHFIHEDVDQDVIFSIEYIVSNFSTELLTILKSKHNKHSKYDILIIKELNSRRNNMRIPLVFKDILELYKNRKAL